VVVHRAANAMIGVLTIIAGTADIMAAATHVAMPTIGVMTAEVMQGAVILVMAVRAVYGLPAYRGYTGNGGYSRFRRD
jgi:hypothetical protein